MSIARSLALCAAVFSAAMLFWWFSGRAAPEQPALRAQDVGPARLTAPADTCCEPGKTGGTQTSPRRQTDCPVCGGALSADVCAAREGKCVYFCSAACRDAFREEPEGYMEKLKDQGVRLDEASSCRHLDGQAGHEQHQ